jgi:hypothetical protein
MNLYRNNITIGDIPQLDVVVPKFFPKTGLVSYYKLDGNSNDAHGSNDGTVNGATYTASGKINGAYSFDGSNDKITVPSGVYSLFSGTKSYTLNIWVYLNSSNTSCLFFCSPGTSYSGRYKTIALSIQNNIFRFFRCNGSSYEDVLAFGSISTSSWYMVTITYDGSTMKGYVNKTLEGSLSSSLTATTPTFGNIGVWQESGSNYYWLNGIIDEVGIWSRALTSDEITQLYNNGNGLTY